MIFVADWSRDMSYGIMGNTRNSHMLTYQTTRQVKCIYFDGESATLFGTGQLDTQMLHIFGNVTGPPSTPENAFRGLWQEYARAIGLCDWVQKRNLGGNGWGVEGIVRMNAGFEMIWCNFTSPSVRLVSHLNVTAPQLPRSSSSLSNQIQGVKEEGTPTSYYPLPPSNTRSDRATDPANVPVPPNWRFDLGREPFFRSQAWNWFASSTAHYGSSGAGPGRGETRVKPLGCGFLSYYSPKFIRQAFARGESDRSRLNLTKDGLWKHHSSEDRKHGLTELMRRRRAHTLGDVTTEDAAIMVADSERVLRELNDQFSNCSGMDWINLTNEIVQTYASSLQTFLLILKQFEEVQKGNSTALEQWMIVARDQTHTFLLPFVQYPTNDTYEGHYGKNSIFFNDTYARCTFHHTRLLAPSEGISLGPEETLLNWAVEETTSGICNVLVDTGLSIEGEWQARFNQAINTTAIVAMDSLKKEVLRWTQGVEELMAWLGWVGEWTYCERKCEWDEKCFIPMWPLLKMGGPGRGPRGPGYGRPGYGRPGYEPPGYEKPPDVTPPSNRTDRRGPGWWQPDESDLWQPRCIKADYLARN
jgi:hypothetical protein